MTVLPFLVIGAVGVVLLLVTLVVGDLLSGVLDAFGGGADWMLGAVAGFLGAFGFAGAIVLGTTEVMLVAVLAGLAAVATRYLQRGGDETTVRSSALVGLTGIVINDIPAQGYGEVSVVVAGHLTKLNARCPEPLAAGNAVIIDAVLSPTSVSVVPRMI
jgi:membrane protein implicated in regulation of membrane protease activity